MLELLFSYGIVSFEFITLPIRACDSFALFTLSLYVRKIISVHARFFNG